MGGTPGYMTPEQARALEAVREGRAIPDAIDDRADVYSLGFLLHEALGGAVPSEGGGPATPLHRCNRRVSVGLSDLIRKCMAPDPVDRYPDAAALAADLRRFLDGRPLRGVPNRSPAERWRNWRRRLPHALTRGVILLVSALTTTAAAALLWAAYLQRAREVEAALADGQAYLERRQYPEAARAFWHGLAVIGRLPGTVEDREALAAGLARSRGQGKAEELYRLAELVRFRYGLDPPPLDEARSLIHRSRAIWRDRSLIVDEPGGPGRAEADKVVRADLLDVALTWSNLLVRQAPADEADRAKEEARRVLDEAEGLLGPSVAGDRDRRAHLGSSERPASSPTPPSAGDHFELGKSYLRAGEIGPAAEQFQLGLDLRPQDFWLNFYQGLCAYRLGRPEEAIDAFRVCIALSPESAECFHNRALALGALGRTGEAIRDYGRALELNPSLGSAALNRGMLHYQEGRLAAAADLKRALASADGRDERGVIHYNLSLVDLAMGDRAAALANLEVAESHGHEAAHLLRGRLPK